MQTEATFSDLIQICHINDFTSEQLKQEQQRYDESRTIAQVSQL